ncbi:MAG: hypothetical protein ACFE0S_08455 [Rhodospirillales bacterium]
MTTGARAFLFWVFVAAVLLPMSARAEPVAVQLKPVAMPAITEKGYQGRTTFTPYIEVQSAAAVERLCGRLPRLMDAFLVALEERPVQLGDVGLDIAARQDMFKSLADTSVGTGVFKAFYLVRGSKTRGEGTEAYFLDGATRECTPVKYLPWTASVPVAAAEQEAAPQRPAPDADTAAEPEGAGIPTPEIMPTGDVPSPLSEEQLARAEAELLADLPEAPKTFPGAPAGARKQAPGLVETALALLGIAGVMMVVGSYVGYQVAKARRERRRRERRKARKDRRAGVERRQRQDGPPASGERRAGGDRRQVTDRRKGDRRAKRDRRDESDGDNPEPDTEN